MRKKWHTVKTLPRGMSYNFGEATMGQRGGVFQAAIKEEVDLWTTPKTIIETP